MDIPEHFKHEAAILDFLANASPREIQSFIHQIHMAARARFLSRAKIALKIKLAEKADLLADKLCNQTDRLVKFTVGLWGFTVILVVFAFIQIIIMLMDYCSKNH